MLQMYALWLLQLVLRVTMRTSEVLNMRDECVQKDDDNPDDDVKVSSIEAFRSKGTRKCFAAGKTDLIITQWTMALRNGFYWFHRCFRCRRHHQCDR